MIDKIVENYIKLRDKKAAMEAAHKRSLAQINEMLDKTELYLLQQMQSQGVDAFKTAAGTAYTQLRTSATVGDWDSFLPWVRENGMWNMLERRVSKTAVDEFRAANDDLPPGVNYRAEKVVNVRR